MTVTVNSLVAGGSNSSFYTANTTTGLVNNFTLSQHKRAPQPTASTNGAGVLTGTYYYRITFVTPTGETEAGPYATVVCSSNQVRLTNIAVSTDASCTARKVYRSTSSSGQYDLRLVNTIADNTTTTYDDNLADGSLGAQAPHINTTGGQLKISAIGATGAGERVGIQLDETTITVGYDSNPNGQGYNNTAIGVVSMTEMTTGYNNVAVGNATLTNVTTGTANTAIGYGTLVNLANASGSSSNTAVGTSAGGSVTYAIENTFIGAGAFTGSAPSNNYAGNTVVGYQAYGSQGTNVLSYNVALGYRAGRLAFSANANYNIFIGPEAGSSAADSPAQSASVSNSIAIGRQASTNRSNQAVIGSADTSTGITETQLQGQVRCSYQDTSLTAPNASAALQVDSTSRGFLPPRMTTAQRTAISSPSEGLIVYDTDLDAMCFYSGSLAAWQKFSFTAA